MPIVAHGRARRGAWSVPDRIVGIDWSHKLARGLIGAFPLTPDVQNQSLTSYIADGTMSGTATYRAGSMGPMRLFDGTSASVVNFIGPWSSHVTQIGTISVWASPDVLASLDQIISLGRYASELRQKNTATDGEFEGLISTKTPTAFVYSQSGATNMVVGKLHHLLITWDLTVPSGTTLRGYMDGVPIGTSTVGLGGTLEYAGSDNCYIGARNTSWPWHGLIGHVQIHNRWFPSNEALEHYHEGGNVYEGASGRVYFLPAAPVGGVSVPAAYHHLRTMHAA